MAYHLWCPELVGVLHAEWGYALNTAGYADHPLLESCSNALQHFLLYSVLLYLSTLLQSIQTPPLLLVGETWKIVKGITNVTNSLSLGEIAEVLLKAAVFFWFQQNLHQIPGFTEEHPLGTVPGATWCYGWSSLVPCGKWYHGATGNRKIHQEYIPILDFLWNIRKAGELNHPFSGKFGCIQPIILDTLDIISHVPIHIESRGSRKPYDFSRCSTYTGFSRSKPNWRWLLPGW